MKTKQKFWIAVICYTLSIIALILGTNYYIENKTKKLWRQAIERFENFFKNQDEFVDTSYSNTFIKFSETSKPDDKPTYYLSEDEIKPWKEKHSNIFKYFKIDKVYDGWNIFVAKKKDFRTMVVYNIYPSYVGYLKQENSYLYDWIPSVETCVNEAYEFWSKNPKSRYFDNYQKGNKERVEALIDEVPNEYFGWGSNKDKIQPGSSLSKNMIGTMGYMHTGYYRVFAESTKWETYELLTNYKVINYEWNKIIIIGGVILTTIFIFFLIYINIQRKRSKDAKLKNEMEYERRKHEPIYDKLKELCNPASFMNPYDKNKVEIANSIYEQLMKTNSSDIEILKGLRKKATDELGLNFVNSEFLQYLKNQCNPERFLSPYNADKVRIANEVYQRLLDNENNIDVLEEIEKEINADLL